METSALTPAAGTAAQTVPAHPAAAPAPAPATPDATQRSLASLADVLEHAMRLTSDDLLVVPFTDAPAGSASFLSALGRLLSDPSTVTGALPFGTPLHQWGSSDPAAVPLLANWRDTVSDAPRSLWGELVMLESLTGPHGCADAFTGLLTLRDRCTG